MLAFSLSSCTIWSIVNYSSSSQEKASTTSMDSEPVSPSNVMPFSLKNVGETVATAYCPSTGNVNILVIPVEFSDYSFSLKPNFLSLLNNALNGNGSSDTGYWESAASFFRKSSYGKLNLTYTIAPIYRTGITAQAAINSWGGQLDNAGYFLKTSIANYKLTNSTKQFDSDGDGLIDNVIMVYSCPHFQSGCGYRDDSNNTFMWAYTYWAPYTYSGRQDTSWVTENYNSPNPNTYIWLSYDFFYKSDDFTKTKADPHTIIHESGHSFGLDDYYPSGSSTFYPMGGITMMDLNILDLDAYSKMVLGWYSPKIVQESKVVSISALAETGDAILIPTSSWNGTALDEYILLEYYKPRELNYLDSHTAYPNRRLGPNINGIKIYHVDSRLIKCRYGGSTFNYSYVTGPLNSLDSSYYYEICASNCNKKENTSDSTYPATYSSNFSLVHLIEAGGTNTFVYGANGGNGSLFTQGASFSMNSFSNFFPNGSGKLMNNGDSFDYRIVINSISSDQAQIQIIKG